MIVLGILLFIAFALTFLYLYFEQYLQAGIVYWSIPIVLIISIFIAIGLLLLILGISLLFRPRNQSTTEPRKFYSLFTYQVAKLLQIIYKIEVVFENKELIPTDQKFVLISNHQSNLDPIVLVASFKGYPLTYIMKDNIMKIPIIGRWLFAAGFFPLDRHNDRKALETIIQGVRRLKNGYPIGVFPEGTRSKGPNVNEFRNGIFKLAQKAAAPILVICVDNFYKVKKRFLFRKTKVLIRICELLPYEEFCNLHTNEIGDHCKNIINANLLEARSKYSWLN